MKLRKSWREKLDHSGDLPKLEEVTASMSQRWGPGPVFIPSPRLVDEVMRGIPSGRLITSTEIREHLARRHGAAFTCPITTGIFANIAAHASEEAAAEGEACVTPWWRTLKAGGELNPKYPGGHELQKARLEAEGHTMTQRGSKVRVRDYDACLHPLD